MTYAKPEISKLGDATSIIRSMTKAPPLAAFDTVDNRFDWQPAYDLDD